jgi:hypothetical protein
MSLSVEALWKMADLELIGAYYEARRQYADKKFSRDTQRARLEWLRAKAFAATYGSVTQRRNTVEVSEELARKGQEVREMTHDLDLLRADVDLIEMMVRLRGGLAATRLKPETTADEEETTEESA